MTGGAMRAHQVQRPGKARHPRAVRQLRVSWKAEVRAVVAVLGSALMVWAAEDWVVVALAVVLAMVMAAVVATVVATAVVVVMAKDCKGR